MSRSLTHTLDRIGQQGAYVALYVTLDWLSLIQPFVALGITPWNPPAGLSFALFLSQGWRLVPATVLAIALSDVILRGLTMESAETLPSALVIALGYAGAAWLLRRRVRISLGLEGHRDLLWLLGIALAASLAIALVVVAIFAATGRAEWASFVTVAVHFWVGDVIGIAVLTPFLLLMSGWRGRLRAVPHNPVEMALQLAAIGLGLWVIFGLERSDHFEFSYTLFLPLVWIALRGGLIGATWGIVATQLGLILAVQLKGFDAATVTQFQVLMLAVAVTGLVLGSVVDERRRAELWQKEHEAELAHAARGTATAELARALAHELNQPLTALVGFARAAQTHLDAGAGGDPAKAKTMVDRAAQQATRAGEILRNLREFLGRGDLRVERRDLPSILRHALETMRPLSEQHRVSIDVRLAPGLPDALVDPIQVEQVLINLLRNSIEELAASEGGHAREIVVEARSAPGDPAMIEVTVRDNGPGFDADIAARLFTPFATTKQGGMGLGLSISRSIVEAHGGRIWVEPMPPGRGAQIRLTLPQDQARASE